MRKLVRFLPLSGLILPWKVPLICFEAEALTVESGDVKAFWAK